MVEAQKDWNTADGAPGNHSDHPPDPRHAAAERKVSEIERFTGSTFERIDPEPEVAPPPVLEATMATLFIGAGRKEKMRPGDILGALTGEAGGLSATSVGKIEVHDHFAYVAVTRNVARSALECLRAGTIKGKKHRVEAVKS
jgi:ATP-independent RNA helicase DbpA